MDNLIEVVIAPAELVGARVLERLPSSRGVCLVLDRVGEGGHLVVRWERSLTTRVLPEACVVDPRDPPLAQEWARFRLSAAALDGMTGGAALSFETLLDRAASKDPVAQTLLELLQETHRVRDSRSGKEVVGAEQPVKHGGARHECG